VNPQTQVASVAFAASMMAALASSQSAGGYDLSLVAIPAGGGISSGQDYVLAGSVAPGASGTMSGDSGRVLSGGFWPAVRAGGDSIFHNGFDTPP
jgi:hypothetical protein